MHSEEETAQFTQHDSEEWFNFLLSKGERMEN